MNHDFFLNINMKKLESMCKAKVKIEKILCYALKCLFYYGLCKSKKYNNKSVNVEVKNK